MDVVATVSRAAAALTLVLAMAGCTLFNRPPDPHLALRVSNGMVEFAVCIDIEVANLSADYRNTGDWTTFWKFDNEMLNLEAGERFSLASVPAALAVDAFEPPLQPGDMLNVLLTSRDQTEVIHADFKVPEDGMPDEGWLRTDGSVAQDPCPGL